MLARRRRRWSVALTIVGALVAVAAGFGYIFWPQIFALIEEEMIYADKARNWAEYSAGKSLSGTPDLKNLSARIAAQNLQLGAPVFMRIFKREFELEMWMKRNGKFELFATYPICMWSGGLGPKLKQGDRQAPEGIYTVELDGVESQQQIPSFVQSRVSQRLRSRTWSHRLAADGARRLPLHRLLRDDR